MEISIPIGLEGGQTSPTASVPAAVPEGQWQAEFWHKKLLLIGFVCCR